MKGALRICTGLLIGLFFVEAMFSDTVVATYNVRNYLTMDRLVEGKWRKEYPKPESEKRVIRESIRAVRPDILVLQEIGSAAHLEELRRDLRNEGLFFSNGFSFAAEDDVRRLAVLWTKKLRVRPIGHRDLTIKYFDSVQSVKRGLLELQVQVGANRWTLFTAHLKSKYTDDKRDPLSLIRRSKEAEAIRDRILELIGDEADARYLIAGDLNDTPNNRPLRALFKKGKRVISLDIPALDERGEIWTHYYRKGATYSKVDYILRSPGFRELKDATAKIHSPDNYYEGSDHRLVWVKLPDLK